MVLRSLGNGERTASYFVFHTEAGLSDVFKNVKKIKITEEKLLPTTASSW